MISRMTALLSAGLLAVTLTGCGAQDAETSTGSPETSPNSQSTETPQNAPAADGPAELYVTTVHDVEIPDAGTAWIEVEGTRIELGDATCDYNDALENSESLATNAYIMNHPDHGDVQLSTARAVGDGKRTPFESDRVQLSLIGGSEFRENNGISSVSHYRDAKGHDWDFGEGEPPIIRAHGDIVTAVGVLEGVPFAEKPLEGTFRLALNCG